MRHLLGPPVYVFHFRLDASPYRGLFLVLALTLIAIRMAAATLTSKEKDA